MSAEARVMGAAGRIDATRETVLRRQDDRQVVWRTEDRPVAYADAVAFMETRVDAIRQGSGNELVWLVEHPPLYTAGTSAGSNVPAGRFPVHRTGRGGQVTYHGPGQRVVYVMLDLQARGADVRAFVATLERWIIDTLGGFGILGERRDDRVGVWVARPDKAAGLDGTPAEDKIAAIGIRVRRWVTFHGISLNVDPDLSHYRDITPCGIVERHFGVTSLADLGCRVGMAEVDGMLRDRFAPLFGATRAL